MRVVDAALDDGRRDKHVELSGGELLHHALELLAAHQPLLEHQIVYALAGAERCLGQLGRGFVTQIGIESRHHSDTVAHHPTTGLLVGRDARDAPVAQRVHAADQHLDVLEQAVYDDRLHDVQFQLAGLGGDRNRQIVSDYPESHLIDDFGDHRIDLAGHNRRAGLHRRQVDLAQTGPGAGRQQPQVVAYLRHFRRQPLQGRRIHDERARIVRGLDQVRRRDDGQAGNLAQITDAQRRVVGIGIDPGPDSRRAHVHLQKQAVVLLDAVDLLRQIRGIGLELLPERHRHGIL